MLRLGVIAGFTLVGAGAGLTAATATVANVWIRTALAVVGGAAGLAGGAMTDRFSQRRQGRAEAERERSLALSRVIPEQVQTDSVFDLLLASSEVTPFWGRRADLTWLEKWLDDPQACPVAVVTGPAGVGKTRLATQFAAQRPEAWIAGWLNRGRGSDAVSIIEACGDPALVLVDDADERPDCAAVLECLAASGSATSSVRVVLISRTADLPARLERKLPDRYRSILAGVQERPIGPFGNVDDHARWFGEAVRAYARALRTPPPDLPGSVSAGSFDPDEPILTMQAQALLMVLESRRGRPSSRAGATPPFDDVASLLFKQEEHRWQKSATLPDWGLTDLTEPNQSMAIAALVLASPLDQAQAVATLRRVPDLADASAERLANIARWAAGLYPADPPWPIRIRPDLLAEWFVVTQLTRTPELIGPARELTRAHASATLAVLARASDHMAAAVPIFADLVSANPTYLAEAGIAAALTANAGRRKLDNELAKRILHATWSDESLSHVENQPTSSLPRTQAAIAEARVGIARAEADAADLAAPLATLGSHLAELGRFEEATAAAEESVSLYRALAQENPGLRSDLAAGLASLGTGLAELGRFEEARTATEESVSEWRLLARDDPTLYPNLARALTSLGSCLAKLSRSEEACTVAEESVSEWRLLARANPAWRPDLADSLTSLGIRLAELGRWEKARSAAWESVELYRSLVQDNPALQPGLAAALTSLGIRLAELGRSEDARAAAEESVSLYRPLARDNPTFYPDLARALDSLAARLGKLGNYLDALPKATESVRLLLCTVAETIYVPSLFRRRTVPLADAPVVHGLISRSCTLLRRVPAGRFVIRLP